MAYDESLADSIRGLLARAQEHRRKEMFGGIGFLLNGNMLVGVWKEFLIVRLDPHQAEEGLLQPHVRPFDITGRPMKGWLMVATEGTRGDPVI